MHGIGVERWRAQIGSATTFCFASLIVACCNVGRVHDEGISYEHRRGYVQI